MLALAVTGACLLAMLGPSQPGGPRGRTVYQVRSRYVILAKQLAPAPRYLALNSRSEAHATAGAEVGVDSDATPPEGAPTSIDRGKPSTVSEGRSEASRPRVTATNRYMRQWLLRSSYASVRQKLRHVATKSRRREKPTNVYARYYRSREASFFGRYQIAGQGYGY